MYKLIIGLKEVGEYETFPKAFEEMYKKIQEMINSEGGISLQWLETTNFIEENIGDEERPLSFYDCRDLAYAIGLMEDGKLREGQVFLSPEDNMLIELTFISGKITVDIVRNKTMEKIKEWRDGKVADGG